MPLPHTCTQTLGDPEHAKPLSGWQSELQPSPLARLPSSHPSNPVGTPLPQIGTTVTAENDQRYWSVCGVVITPSVHWTPMPLSVATFVSRLFPRSPPLAT